MAGPLWKRVESTHAQASQKVSCEGASGIKRDAHAVGSITRLDQARLQEKLGKIVNGKSGRESESQTTQPARNNLLDKQRSGIKIPGLKMLSGRASGEISAKLAEQRRLNSTSRNPGSKPLNVFAQSRSRSKALNSPSRSAERGNSQSLDDGKEDLSLLLNTASNPFDAEKSSPSNARGQNARKPLTLNNSQLLQRSPSNLPSNTSPTSPPTSPSSKHPFSRDLPLIDAATCSKLSCFTKLPKSGQAVFAAVLSLIPTQKQTRERQFELSRSMSNTVSQSNLLAFRPKSPAVGSNSPSRSRALFNDNDVKQSYVIDDPSTYEQFSLPACDADADRVWRLTQELLRSTRTCNSRLRACCSRPHSEMIASIRLAAKGRCVCVRVVDEANALAFVRLQHATRSVKSAFVKADVVSFYQNHKNSTRTLLRMA